MASEDDPQKLHSPVADERQKLDGFKLFDTESPHNMKKSGTLLEHNCDIRQSLAWDSAFFTSPGVLEPEELFQNVNCGAKDSALNILEHDEDTLLSESFEPENTSRVEKCDLRKSLAWDNAFFTNAGVLDPEELSHVNRGFKKFGTSLPGIQEDVWRSTESNSTIGSGNSTLSSLEIDLFEDTGASMHKLTSTSGVATSSLKLPRGESNRNLHIEKVLGTSSQTRMKDMPRSRRPSIKPHRGEKSKGSVSVAAQKQLSAGSMEINSSSSLQPLKILDQVKDKSASTKRASLVANIVKEGKGASGGCSTMKMKPCPGELTLTRTSTPSPKSPSFSQAELPASSSSRINSSRKKINSTEVNLVANGSTFRNPVRCTTRSKSDAESSDHRTSLLPRPKSSSCTSPDSSLDGWSSESSSASVNQGSNNSKAVTCKQVNSESTSSQLSASKKHMYSQSCISPFGNENQSAVLPNQRGKQIPLGSGSLPTSFPKNIKPSGLRLPSPKIGFFDVANSSLPAKDGFPQPHCDKQSAESRVGTSINKSDEAANRAKYGKIHPSRTSNGTRKQNDSQPAMRIRPKRSSQIEEMQNATVDGQANGLPRKTGSKNHLETAKVRIKDDEAAGLVIQSSTKVENEGAKGRSGRNYEKENIYRFKDEVDSLSMHVGGFNLGNDAV